MVITRMEGGFRRVEGNGVLVRNAAIAGGEVDKSLVTASDAAVDE